jgi:hypothetical protein
MGSRAGYGWRANPPPNKSCRTLAAERALAQLSTSAPPRLLAPTSPS